MSKEKSPEEEDHEEKDMEKFYALVKNHREGRDRRMQEMDETEGMNKKRKCSANKITSGWMPSFEWEDFKQENAELLRKSLRMLPPPAAAAHNNNANPDCTTTGSVSDSQGKKGEDGVDLDLKLSL